MDHKAIELGGQDEGGWGRAMWRAMLAISGFWAGTSSAFLVLEPA
jgi:hypothetical protein